MSSSESEIDRLRQMITEVCDDPLVAEPAKFLAALMAGKDPRERDSKLYRLIKSIRDEDRMPDESEWLRIAKMVLYTDLYRVSPVSLDESAKAAKELMAYLHAKRKSISLRGKVAHKHIVISELSPDEVETFEDWFTASF